MYIEIGISDRRRCIDILKVVSEIRKEVCLALPVFIGLQELVVRAPFTESIKLTFYGIGKVKALSIIFDLKVTSKPSKKSEISSH